METGQKSQKRQKMGEIRLKMHGQKGGILAVMRFETFGKLLENFHKNPKKRKKERKERKREEKGPF